MAELGAPLLPDLFAWQAALMRLTVFPILDPKMNGEGWWEAVVGATPDRRSSQPRQQVLQEEGPFLGGELTLNKSPLRIDWLLAASLEQRMQSDTFPVLENLPRLVESFENGLSKWLSSGPRIKRLAFGAELIQQVASHEEGYLLLDKYLPSVEVQPGTSEFMYQINRPRQSRVTNDMKVNRLSKWSVAKFVGLQLQIQQTGDVANQVSGVASDGVYGCRLEVDINTDASRVEPISQEEAPSIFGELVALGLEIARQGDVP